MFPSLGNIGSFKQSAKQKGQALVVILLFSVGTILLSFAVFNNAILVNEKMELQNAADAAAFSVSTLEARDLNFSSYINRAMVANEVAMGQIVGLMSWAIMFQSIGPTLNFYLQPILTAMSAGSAGILSTAQAAISGFLTALTTAGSTIYGAVRPVSTIASQAVYFVNLAYSGAQRAFSFATLFLSMSTLGDILRDNDSPNFAGARPPDLSAFGLMSLVGHFSTHYPDLAFTGNSFVTSYAQDRRSQLIPHSPLNRNLRPNNAEQLAGMERFAALVNESRDRFTDNRDGGWTLPLSPFPPFRLRIRLGVGDLAYTFLDVRFSLNLDLNRRGGSDLRYKRNSGEQLYSWSGADTTTLDMSLNFSIYVFEIINISINPPSVGIPIGIGAAQTASRNAALGSTSPVPVANMRRGLGGQVEDHNYGGSPGVSNTTWFLPFNGATPPVRSPSWNAGLNNINRSYALPRYNDTKLGPDPIGIRNQTLGFESPFLIIGLTKDSDQVRDPNRPGVPSGRLDLAENHADDELGVIAKSEVFFSRPNTLSYFRRGDGRTELASAFNPYWDARLVDTTVLDRMTAIGMQQEQLWLPSFGGLGAAATDFRNALNWFTGFVSPAP